MPVHSQGPFVPKAPLNCTFYLLIRVSSPGHSLSAAALVEKDSGQGATSPHLHPRTRGISSTGHFHLPQTWSCHGLCPAALPPACHASCPPALQEKWLQQCWGTQHPPADYTGLFAWAGLSSRFWQKIHEAMLKQ